MSDQAPDIAKRVGAAPTLVDRAYDLIRRRIAETEPSPDILLSELSLSRELAIGRTPVREALQRLASQGLVTIVPRRGAAISPLGRDEALQAIELRRELDPAIAGAAALRATFRHRALLAELSAALRGGRSLSSPGDTNLLDAAFAIVREACSNPHLRRAAETAHAVGDRTVQRRLPSGAQIRDRVADLCRDVADGEPDAARRSSAAVLDAIEPHADSLPQLASRDLDPGDGDAPSMTETAYLLIEAKIVSGELKPGMWLSQSQLARLLDFGRTTIREATLRLASEHLVEISPRKGIFVAEVDFSERFQIIEARRPLERALALRCAARIQAKEASELRKLGRTWVEAAQKGDNATVQMVDQAAKSLLLASCASPVLRYALAPIFTLSRRLYFSMLQTPNPDMARGYASWLEAIAAGEGARAARISGFIAAEAEHLLNASRLA